MSLLSEAAARDAARFALVDQSGGRSYSERWQYYRNRDLYRTLERTLGLTGRAGGKGLYNPVSAVVEVYAAHIWPGALPAALPMTAKSTAVEEAIRRIHTWSNLGASKQAIARWLPAFGDAFLKVVGHRSADGRYTAVYIQNVDPHTVTDFEIDARGFVTWIRFDTIEVYEAQGRERTRMRTEVASKARGDVRVWLTNGAQAQALSRREPTTEPDSVTPLSDYGIDFVPVVHIPCLNIGETRGAAPYDPELDKIDELNDTAARLHEMLFAQDRPFLAIESNHIGADGLPLPAPLIEESEEAGPSFLRGLPVLRLPGNTRANFTVPSMNWQGQLRAIEMLLEEIESRMPELVIWHVARGRTQIATETAEIMLGNARARILEVRANAEQGLVRAENMALTLAQALDLDGFSASQIGTYESGGFDHTYNERDVFARSRVVLANTTKTLVDADVPTQHAAIMAGWEAAYTDEIARAQAQQQQQDRASLAESLLRAREALDSGDTGEAGDEEADE